MTLQHPDDRCDFRPVQPAVIFQKSADVSVRIAAENFAVPKNEFAPGERYRSTVTNEAFLTKQRPRLHNGREVSDHHVELAGGQFAVPAGENGSEVLAGTAPDNRLSTAFEIAVREIAREKGA